MSKVSIVIPNYNMDSYLIHAVRSALNQTVADIEVIVTDNASTDNSIETLKEVADRRLILSTNAENLGAIRNFNRGVEMASGTYIKFLEADDLLEADCVEKMLAIMEADEEIVMCCSGRRYIDASGETIGGHVRRSLEITYGNEVRHRTLREGNEFGTPSDVMVRRDVFVLCGGFDLGYGSYLNDWDLWLRIAQHGKIAFVAEKLAIVRRHQQQMGATGARDNRDVDVMMRMVDKCFSDDRSYSTWLKIHFAAEFLRRAVVQVLKAPNSRSFTYFCATWKKLLERVGGIRTFAAFIYCPSILQYFYVRHKWKYRV